MDFPLRKGTTYISVICQNLSYPLDLYCSNIKLVVGNEKILEMDFNSIFNAKQQTHEKDDLSKLINNLGESFQIEFSDRLITEKMRKRVKQNEEISVKLIAGQTFETKMRIVYQNKEEFNLEK